MTRPAIDRRIFVVGVPRSGTTLVQSLLAAHSASTSFTESHFFSRHFRPLPRFSSAILTRNPAPRLQEFLIENDVEHASMEERIRRALPARLLLPLRTRPVARELLRVLDELTVRRGRSTWIEKTPGHLRYLPFLEGLSASEGQTHFVHVIREGLDVVASLHRASQSWDQPYDLETCVERWNYDVCLSLERVAVEGGRGPVPLTGERRNATAARDHFVFYEDLTRRPDATLEQLLADLGLGWEPEILDRYSSRRLVTREETWKADVDRGVRRSAASRSALSDEQRDRISAALRHDLYTRLRQRTVP